MSDAPDGRGAGALHDLHGPARRAVVGHHEGSLRERVATVATLRRELARGRLPPLHDLPWPSPALRAGLFEVFERAQAAKLCHGRPKVARSVVEWALEALEGAERVQAQAEVALAVEGASSSQTAREDAASLALSMMTAAGHRRWAHAEELRQLCNCLSGTPDGPTPNGSRRRGSKGATPVSRRFEALLARVVRADPSFVVDLLPCVQTVAKHVEELGRHPVLTPKAVADDGPVAPFEAPSRHVETQGIERGSELSRMLPSEAVLLAHPLLRGLWHARRAERALLLYAVEGVARDDVPSRGEEEDPPEPRGPLIVLLDTSSSMAGVPANLAKATLLHLATVCDVERRRLLLIEFSGPDDLLEVELGFEGAGLERLWDVLCHRFCGSTEPGPAVEHAVRRLDELAWRGADVVLVSDGYFAVPEALANRLERSRLAHGTRWVGVATSRGPGWEELRLDELHALHHPTTL